MFTWKKLGRVFNPSDVKGISWLHEFAQAPSALVFERFVRIYFSGRPPQEKDGNYISYTGYVDLNRKNLLEVLHVSAKPVLELGMKGTFDEFGIYPASVVRKENQIHAYYGGWTRCESVPFNVAIGYAVSNDDGETFTKPGNGPVLSYSLNEPFILSGPKVRIYNDRWYLWYIAGRKWKTSETGMEPVYKIRMATSENGMDWKKEDRDLIENKLEDDECQASPDVFFYGNKYHMFFCYRKSLNYRGKEGGYRIGYASSVDLLNWTRDDKKAGIDISDEGWDSEMIAYPHILELDSEIYMLYLGNHVGKYGFGIARLIS